MRTKTFLFLLVVSTMMVKAQLCYYQIYDVRDLNGKTVTNTYYTDKPMCINCTRMGVYLQVGKVGAINFPPSGQMMNNKYLYCCSDLYGNPSLKMLTGTYYYCLVAADMSEVEFVMNNVHVKAKSISQERWQELFNADPNPYQPIIGANREPSRSSAKSSCSYCHGTGIDPSPSYGPNYVGTTQYMDHRCEICGKIERHYHKKCPSCSSGR